MTTQLPTPAPAATPPARPYWMPFWANPRLGLVVLLVVLVALFSALRPAFLNPRLTLTPLQSDISVYVVVGLAQLSVLSLGHMNMAVGRMAATSAFAMGLVHDRLDAGLVPSLAASLLVGALLGALAGLIISRTGVNSFVVTLAMDFALVGLVTILYTGATDVVAFPTMPAGMDALRSDTFADYCLGQVCGPRIPLVVPFAVLAALLVGLLFRYSRLGREMLMSGASLRAAELPGIPTRQRIVQAHALSGLVAALAGFLLTANNGAFSASIGEGFLLPSFLVPVPGGTLLAGGMVSVTGTLLAAFLVRLVAVMQAQFAINPRWVDLIIGAIVLGAVLLGTVRQRLRERAT